MSSTKFIEKSSPALSKRSAQKQNDRNTMNSQPLRKKRSLSDRVRNIFGRDTSSKSRDTSEQRKSTLNIQDQSASESPQLRAPAFNWSNAKDKNNTVSSKSSKGKRKTQQSPIVEISDPINYRLQNETNIQGENYVPRTPPMNYENRDYPKLTNIFVNQTPNTNTYNPTYNNVVDDRVLQANQNNDGAIRPSSYISDRSQSPSMYYNRSMNQENEYFFYNEPKTNTGPRMMPMGNVEVLDSSDNPYRTEGSSIGNTTQNVTRKPPQHPQVDPRSSSGRQSPYAPISDNRKSLYSSTSINSNPTSDANFKELDVPRLNTAGAGYGSISSANQDRSRKSKSRDKLYSGSTTTISRLVEQNPLAVTRSWASTYGSLPDAEILDDRNMNSRKPPKKTSSKYPWLTAIVEKHMIRDSQYTLPPTTTQYPETTAVITTTNSNTTTTSTATPTTRPQRYDTSTSTPVPGEEYSSKPWKNSTGNIPDSSLTIVGNQDGFIRPLSPDRNSGSIDIGVIRIGLNITTPLPEGQHYSDHHSEVPNVYRSSATIYTRDKNDTLERGEIRTWPSPQLDLNENHRETHVVPTIRIEIDKDYQENRYSPRITEGKYTRQRDEEDEIQEECYEISYAHGRQIDKSVLDTRRYYEDDKISNRYAEVRNSAITNLNTYRSEQEQSYHYTTLPPNESTCVKESYNRSSPVDFSQQAASHTIKLKRAEGFDGLGIFIATDANTRSYHFIRDVEAGSLAARAGLKKDDRIIGVNNTNVEHMDFSDVLLLIKQGLNNNDLEMTVIRENDSI